MNTNSPKRCYVNKIPRSAASILIAALVLSGCSAVSTVRIDSAKQLGSSGQKAADSIAENVFISDAACEQVMEVQTLMFYHDIGEAPPADLEKKFNEMISRYKALHEELRARRAVFAQLGATYAVFAELADNESAADTEATIRKLGETINKYAEALDKDKPLSGDVQRGLGILGKVAVNELKNKKIKQVSGLIRECLTAFVALLKEPLVKEQFVGLQENIASIKKDGVATLWEAGVLDPSPLLDQIGADIGLRATPDVAAVIRQNKNLNYGMNKIITNRLVGKLNLLRENYEASIGAMEELIREHETLEHDGPLNLIKLVRVTTEQQQAALLSTGGSTNKEVSR